VSPALRPVDPFAPLNVEAVGSCAVLVMFEITAAASGVGAFPPKSEFEALEGMREGPVILVTGLSAI
jgi:hypothetical protein